MLIFICFSCKKEENTTPVSKFPFQNAKLQIELIDDNTPDTLIDLCFFDSLNGLILSPFGKIYKTSDGCKSWNLTYQHNVIERNFHNLEFLDNKVGFAVGGEDNFTTGSVVIRTLDGGNTWQEIFTIDSVDAPIIRSNSLGHIFVISMNRVYKSEDKGNSWIKTILPHQGHMSAMFFNSNTGFIAGGSGRLYKSKDNGIAWSLINFPVTSYIHTIAFRNNKGFAALSGMNLYNSTDNGESWFLSDTVNYHTIRHLRYLGNSVVLGTGSVITGGNEFPIYNAYIRYSFDDGATWKDATDLNEAFFGNTSFYGLHEGYMIGNMKIFKIKIKK